MNAYDSCCPQVFRWVINQRRHLWNQIFHKFNTILRKLLRTAVESVKRKDRTRGSGDITVNLMCLTNLERFCGDHHKGRSVK